jgi:hypothetical protein
MSDRILIECPKCGARRGFAKHGITLSGIDLRNRANQNEPWHSPLTLSRPPVLR